VGGLGRRSLHRLGSPRPLRKIGCKQQMFGSKEQLYAKLRPKRCQGVALPSREKANNALRRPQGMILTAAPSVPALEQQATQIVDCRCGRWISEQ
jgi:hypothetical protein